MNNQELNFEFKTEWEKLISKYTDDILLSIKSYSEIILKYSEKKRYYHTINHILEMFDLFNIYKKNLTNKNSILFAIVYHDYFYDVKRIDNERNSAIFSSKRLEPLNVPEEIIKNVSNLIESTNNHDLKYFKKNSILENDAKYFLDFDREILGTDKSDYFEYIQSIRKEYFIYTDKEFNNGRKNFITNLLNKKRIYYTNEFYEKHEQKARKNLEFELIEINKKLG